MRVEVCGWGSLIMSQNHVFYIPGSTLSACTSRYEIEVREMASLLRARAPRVLLKSWSRNSTAGWRSASRRLNTSLRSVSTDYGRFSLGLDTINPNLREVRYAVRGPVLDRAREIERDLEEVYTRTYVVAVHVGSKQ